MKTKKIKQYSTTFSQVNEQPDGIKHKIDITD